MSDGRSAGTMAKAVGLVLVLVHRECRFARVREVAKEAEGRSVTGLQVG